MAVPREPDEFHILFVCTGNVCRSAFAELLAGRLLQDMAPQARITVASAGCRALTGHGVDPLTRAELARWAVTGAAVAAHAARQVTTGMLAGADLVLAADRTHRAHLARLYPRGLRKTFCVREFHRLAPAHGSPDTPDPLVGMRTVVAEAATARGMSPPPPPGSDDIADPYCRSPEMHHACATMIGALLPDILGRLVPAMPCGGMTGETR